MLSPAATTQGGFNALAYHWGMVEETAREHGTTRRARPLARRRPGAHRRDARAGAARRHVRPARDFLYYFQKVVALPGIPETGTPEECLDAMIDVGFVVVGTPDDLIAQIERLEEQSGGFGAFLSSAHDWANREATRRSYELIARYVMPRFQDANAYTQPQHGVGAGEPHAVPGRRHPGRDGGDPEGRRRAVGQSGEPVGRIGGGGAATSARLVAAHAGVRRLDHDRTSRTTEAD